MSRSVSSRYGIDRFFCYSYVVVLVLAGRFLPLGGVENPLLGIFFLTAASFQAGIYLLPSWLICRVIQRVGLFLQPDVRTIAVTGALLLTNALTLLYLEADFSIFQLYGYHINGFVLNLLFTPGGIASLGVTPQTWLSVALISAIAFLLPIMLLFITRHRLRSTANGATHIAGLGVFILLCGLFQGVTFGIQDLRSVPGYLVVEQRLPFYQPLTFKRLVGHLGYGSNDWRNHPGVDTSKLSIAGISQVNYPLQPIVLNIPKKPLNLIWLVAESLRWDLLNPEIMPASWQFAQHNHRFTHHYSGGNRTRMGMFTMFYGIEGPYWFSFLKEHISPILLDALQRQNYDIQLYTSANFSYPEFNQTLFSRIPKSHLHADSAGPSWQRDRRNVSALLNSLTAHNPQQPFMRFLFFEGTHAPYLFPPQAMVREDYARQLDYTGIADASPDQIRQVFNRYLNAAHHLDSQIQRIVEYLKRNHLLRNTVLILTGDHGEAFMEHGRWGHGSDFTDPQVRVPLVLHIPGTGAGVHNALSSHLDIVPTLAKYFGITNPVQDYSNGFDLFAAPPRKSIIVSDWSGVAYLDNRYLARMPLKTSGYFSGGVTRRDGEAVQDLAAFNRNELPSILLTLQSLQRFSRR